MCAKYVALTRFPKVTSQCQQHITVSIDHMYAVVCEREIMLFSLDFLRRLTAVNQKSKNSHLCVLRCNSSVYLLFVKEPDLMKIKNADHVFCQFFFSVDTGVFICVRTSG